MKANSPIERLYNGIIKENPTFVLMLGMCPTLAVTTSAVNGLGMGLTTMVVLAMSNMMISLLRKVIPDSVRMPAFIVIVASFVTIVQFLLQGFLPSLDEALGIYIPLIVVNCIILGRAEAYGKLPEGYQVEELPQNTRATMNQNELDFSYIIRQVGNIVSLRYKATINAPFIGSEQYEELRNFWEEMVIRNNQQIVLKKVSTQP